MTDMVERVARAIRPDLWSAWNEQKVFAGNASIVGQRFRAMEQARAAMAAVVDYLDCMGTGTDEDMVAVEWIAGLLREAALPHPQGRRE